MEKINWKRKLTSRKFWAAVIAVIMSLMTILKVDGQLQSQIQALGWGIAALIAYIIGEGLVDASASSQKEEKQ